MEDFEGRSHMVFMESGGISRCQRIIMVGLLKIDRQLNRNEGEIIRIEVITLSLEGRSSKFYRDRTKILQTSSP